MSTSWSTCPVFLCSEIEEYEGGTVTGKEVVKNRDWEMNESASRLNFSFSFLFGLMLIFFYLWLRFYLGFADYTKYFYRMVR